MNRSIVKSILIPLVLAASCAEIPATQAENQKGLAKVVERKKEMPAKNSLAVNDKAPNISLPDQSGKNISLQDFLEKKTVVLFFYPKDNTSICTAEACSFRDNYDQFKELGAEVIGISSDSADSHAKFAQEHNLPFTLLSDKDSSARKAFGVPSSLGIMPGRVTYVIDKKGVIRYVFNSQLDSSKHMTEALKMVKELSTKAL